MPTGIWSSTVLKISGSWNMVKALRLIYRQIESKLNEGVPGKFCRVRAKPKAKPETRRKRRERRKNLRFPGLCSGLPHSRFPNREFTNKTSHNSLSAKRTSRINIVEDAASAASGHTSLQ